MIGVSLSVDMRTHDETPSISQLWRIATLFFFMYLLLFENNPLFWLYKFSFSYFSVPALYVSFDITLSVPLSSVSSLFLLRSMDNFSILILHFFCRIIYLLHHPLRITRMRHLVLTGIGDRHAQNILIDTVTAELVHIDFGIVFEQGKTLTTPETVPFRLTR